jgi:hypothetical protein
MQQKEHQHRDAEEGREYQEQTVQDVFGHCLNA